MGGRIGTGLDDDHGLPEAFEGVPLEAGVDEGARQFVGSRYFAGSGNSHWLDRPLVRSVLASRNRSCAPEAVVPVQRASTPNGSRSSRVGRIRYRLV